MHKKRDPDRPLFPNQSFSPADGLFAAADAAGQIHAAGFFIIHKNDAAAAVGTLSHSGSSASAGHFFQLFFSDFTHFLKGIAAGDESGFMFPVAHGNTS